MASACSASPAQARTRHLPGAPRRRGRRRTGPAPAGRGSRARTPARASPISDPRRWPVRQLGPPHGSVRAGEDALEVGHRPRVGTTEGRARRCPGRPRRARAPRRRQGGHAARSGPGRVRRSRRPAPRRSRRRATAAISGVGEQQPHAVHQLGVVEHPLGVEHVEVLGEEAAQRRPLRPVRPPRRTPTGRPGRGPAGGPGRSRRAPARRSRGCPGPCRSSAGQRGGAGSGQELAHPVLLLGSGQQPQVRPPGEPLPERAGTARATVVTAGCHEPSPSAAEIRLRRCAGCGPARRQHQRRGSAAALRATRRAPAAWSCRCPVRRARAAGRPSSPARRPGRGRGSAGWSHRHATTRRRQPSLRRPAGPTTRARPRGGRGTPAGTALSGLAPVAPRNSASNRSAATGGPVVVPAARLDDIAADREVIR